MAGRAVRSWQDKRAFAAFDVGYLDNPKIMHVFDASPIAVCMHFASVLYCAQHLTDGFVSSGTIQRKLGGTDADTQLLLDEKLWHRPGHDCEYCPEVPRGKVYVHDYTVHNRTSDGVKRASEAGRRGAEARWNDDAKANAKRNAFRMHNAYESHSEPQCENDEIAMARQTDRQLKDSSSEPANAGRPEVEELCTLLADLVEANGSKRPTITKAWRDEARRMLDIDGREPQKVANLIHWVQQDSFWRSNIMSMPKFRKQYDALRLRATEDWSKNGGKTGASPDGQIDVDAVLGRDVWSPGTPPEGLDQAEEVEWKKQQRLAHKADRLAEAKSRLGVMA
jgi:hypothetical protein